MRWLPSTPTFIKYSVSIWEIILSLLVATIAIFIINSSSYVFSISREKSFRKFTTYSFAFSIPLFMRIGLPPATTNLSPSRNISVAMRVPVVVLSPQYLLQFSATYWNNLKVRFVALFKDLKYFITVTPSLVTLGKPNSYSIQQFYPNGPKVLLAAF